MNHARPPYPSFWNSAILPENHSCGKCRESRTLVYMVYILYFYILYYGRKRCCPRWQRQLNNHESGFEIGIAGILRRDLVFFFFHDILPHLNNSGGNT
jgi:hypothetical protein